MIEELPPTYFRAIEKISRLLTEKEEFRATMYNILVRLARQTGMKRGMISLYRRDLEEIHVDITYGIPERSSPIFYRLGEGITGQVVATGRPVAIPRLDREPLFLDRSGARKEIDRSTLAFICVPIKYAGETVGALSVDRAAKGGDLKTEVAFLEIIANMLAPRVHARRMKEENVKLREAIDRHGPLGTIVGNAKSMRIVAEQIVQVADSQATVLITGETGTGKGLLAEEIHYRSPRRDQPLVRLNCGAIPENLVESELFGHQKGAFTGAVEQRIGKFEMAQKGTIFLDEIGELPLASQVKLLRVLEEREFERVGGGRTIKTDARIIAATNRDLEQEVAVGRFRSDLYYRLSVFPIHLPPLRERGADIILLADYFVQRLGEKLGKNITRIDSSALDLLISYHWPGNVRELQNCLERAALLATDGIIYGYLLPPSLQAGSGGEHVADAGDTFQAMVRAYETTLIIESLKKSKGNQTKAAKILGTSKRVIQYKIQQYGIDYRKYRGVNV
ncbi:MAG: sigma 54-interacting transcriptional regulator [Deltaproteobacteria bacterium]|nr:sigma 54-interacting transcriptional regulator [Candidatus Anaeroferrophillus wilburensis]MBN2887729.1 sigma 54-interacting transcriptional regulator [Deltaproteobacteria bacterium]